MSRRLAFDLADQAGGASFLIGDGLLRAAPNMHGSLHLFGAADGMSISFLSTTSLYNPATIRQESR